MALEVSIPFDGWDFSPQRAQKPVVSMAQPSVTASETVRAQLRQPEGGVLWRLTVSVIGTLLWVAYALIYVVYWSSSYTHIQSAVILIVPAVVLFGLFGWMWASWGTGLPPVEKAGPT